MKKIRHIIMYRIKQLIIYLLIISFLPIHTPKLYAQQIVDPNAPKNQQPGLDRAQNGVPVINLTAPSAGGISKNKFQDYNVDKNGIILNNSTTVGRSQLGGAVYANPNYRDKAANTVVFEVNGTKHSDILGYTEMFGQKANFVLANPNGIYINGAGFINIPHATLTTGIPNYDTNGNINTITTRQGRIEIGPNGFDANNLDYFDIISRIIAINGTIWSGKDLQIAAGQNNYDYNTRAITKLSSDTSTKPEIGIDATALGAMYAGQIKLICTEDGVGVKLAAPVEANVGNLILNSEGNLYYTSLKSNANLNATAKGTITQKDAAQAAGNIDLTSGQDMNLSGTSLKTGTTLNLTSHGDLTLTGTDPNGAPLNVIAPNLATVANKTSLQNVNVVANNANMQSNNDLSLAQSKVDANTVTIKTMGETHLDNSTVQSTDQTTALKIQTGAYSAQNGSQLMSVADIELTADGQIVNKNSLIQSLGKIDMNSQSLNNDGGAIIAQNNLNLSGASLIDTQGQYSGQDIKLNINNAANLDQSSFTANGDLTILAGDLSLKNSYLSAQKNLNLTAKTSSLTQDQSTLATNANLNLTAATNINNTNSGLTSAGNLNLIAQTGKITDANNYYDAYGNLNFQSQTDLKLNSDLETLGQLNLTGQSLDLKGSLYAASGVTMTGQNVNNAMNVDALNWTINADQDIQNSAKTVKSVNTLNWHAGHNLTNSGDLNSQSLKLVAGATLANSGTIESAGDITAIGTDLTNDGTMLSDTTLSLIAQGKIVNNNSLLANDTTALSANGNIENNNLIQGKNGLTINCADLTNDNSVIITNKNLTITAQNLNNQNNALIQANKVQNLNITNTLTNDNSALVATALNITVTDFNNKNNGDVFSVGRLDLNVTKLTNSAAIESLQQLDIHNNDAALTSLTNTGLIKSGTNLNLNALTASNAGNQTDDYGNLVAGIRADNDLNLTIGSGGFTNTGRIESGNDVNFNKSDTKSVAGFDNINGVIWANNDLNLYANTITNKNGTLAGYGVVNIETNSLDNSLTFKDREGNNLDFTKGILGSTVTLKINQYNLNNQSGHIYAGQTLDFNQLADTLDNTNGKIESDGTISLQQANQDLNNTNGQIISAGQIDFSLKNINNNNGLIKTSDKLNLTAQTLKNISDLTLAQQQAQNKVYGLASDLDMTLNLTDGLTDQANLNTGLLNTNGTIISLGRFSLTAAKNINNENGVITSLWTNPQQLKDSDDNLLGSDINVANLDNQSGKIQSLANLTLTAQSADNTNGYIQTQSNLNINNNSLTNSHGTLFAEDNFTGKNINNDNGYIEVGQNLTLNNDNGIFSNASGTISNYGSLGTLTINAAKNIINTAGILQSQGDIQLNLDKDNTNYTITGTIVANGNYGITARSLTNAGNLSVYGNINFDLSQYFSNNENANLFANGDIIIKALSACNDINADIACGGNLQLNTVYGITNYGRLGSQQNLGVEATDANGSIYNFGQMAAGNNIELKGKDFVNRDKSAVIAQNDIFLKFDGDISNGRNGQADIYSNNGSIYITAKDGIGRANSFHNSAGDIEAQNNVVINAKTISNVIQPGQLVLSSTDTKRYDKNRDYYVTAGNYHWIIFPDDGYSYTFHNVDFNSLSMDRKDVSQYINPNMKPGNIIAGLDMSLDCNSLTNSSSKIMSGRNMYINATTIANNAVTLLDTITYTYHGAGEAERHDAACWAVNTGQNNATYYHNGVTMTSPYYRTGTGGTGVRIGNGGTFTFSKVTGHSVSLIQAGGTLSGTIRDKIDNTNIKAAALVNSPGQKGVNNSYDARLQNIKETGAIDVTDYIKIPQGTNGLFKINRSAGSISGTDLKNVSVGTTPADDKINITVQTKTADVVGSTQVLTTKIEKTNMDVATDPNKITSQESFGTFRPAGDPTPTQPKYLIETNTTLIDTTKFLGSSYLLNRLGFDPLEPILGDPLYENRLIKQAIAQETHQRYLSSDIQSDAEQMKVLYDNAVEAQADMHLSIGITMTKDQINALKKDIIWLVDTVIDGQHVLVPQLFLCRLTAENLSANGGAIVTGKDVDLAVTDGSVENSGQIIAKNNLNIVAKHDIKNIGGTISGGNLVALTTHEGDVINQTEVNTRTYGNDQQTNPALAAFLSGTQALQTNTNIDSNLGRQATISGGNVIINSGHDFISQAGKIKATGIVAIDAANDISLESVALRNRTETGSREGDNHNYTLRDNINNVGSEISADQLVMTSGRDINLIGSTATATNSGYVQAGRDLNLISISDINYSIDDKKSKDGFIVTTTKTDSVETYDQTIKGAKLDLGKGISFITADNDLNMIGSSIKFESAVLDIKHDVNIVEQQETHSRNEKHETSTAVDVSTLAKIISIWNPLALLATGIGEIEVKGHTDELDIMKLKAIDSNLEAQHDLQAAIGNNLLISGSVIKTGGDADIAVNGRVNIVSALERDYKQEMHEDRQFAGLSGEIDLSKLRASASISSTGEKHETINDNVTQKSSELGIGGNLNLTSGQDMNILGSNIVSNGDIYTHSDGNMNVLSVDEMQKIIQNDSQIKNTLTVGISNSWIDAANQVQDNYNGLQNACNAENGNTPEGGTNKVSAGAQAAQSAVQAALLAKKVAESAADAGTLGFNLTATYTHEEQTQTQENTNKTTKGSNIISLNGNIDMSANKKLTIKGSNVEAYNGDLSLAGKQGVEIVAAENSYTQTTGEHDSSYTQTLLSTNIVKQTSGVAIPTYTQNDSSNDTTAITYTNSTVTAKNGTVKIKTGDDTSTDDLADVNIAGGQVLAKKIDMTQVNGNVTITTQQDTINNSSNSSGYSAGDNMGINKSHGEQDKIWVEAGNQSHIIGTEQININTKTLKTKGAIIANIKTDGTDGGNLNITADKIETSDLKDKNHQWNESYGLNQSLNSYDTPEGQKQADPSRGTTHIQASNSGIEHEQTTKATIGQGNITLRGKTQEETTAALTNTNRDITKTQEMTKNEKTGGLNVNNNLDTEIFTNTGDYIKRSADAVTGLPGNAVNATKRISNASNDLTDSILKNGINLPGVTDKYQDKTARREALSKMTPGELDVIANPGNHNETEKKTVADKYNSVYSDMRNIENADAKIFNKENLDKDTTVDGKGIDKRKTVAFSDGDKNKQDIYYEANEINKGDNFANSLGREAKREDQIQKGIVNNTPDGISTAADKASIEAGQHNVAAMKNELDIKGVQQQANPNGTTSYIKSNADNTLINRGTNLANGVTDVQPMSIWDITDVAIFSLSAYDTKKKWEDPNSTNWEKAKTTGFLVLDTVALLPLVPSLGYFRYADKIFNITESISTAKSVKQLTKVGEIGDAASKISSGLNYTNNSIDYIQGDRDNGRFIVDNIMYLAPKAARLNIVQNKLPNISKIAHTDSFNSLINASETIINREMDKKEITSKQ